MSGITNEKIADLRPTWRRYAGLSVLYDNPRTVLPTGVQRIDALPVDDAGRELYAALEEVVARLVRGPLRHLGFCPLPPGTYHVTVCDGVNDGVTASVRPRHRPEVSTLLEGLPDSLLRPSLPLHLLRTSDLLPTVWAHPCTLRVRDLWVGQYVLAAGLEAADERSRRALVAHRRARERLVDHLGAVLGTATQAWRPHVSLGYFPNLDQAAAARDALTATGDSGPGVGTAHHRVTFRSAAVYGFTDMATFWRAGP